MPLQFCFWVVVLLWALFSAVPLVRGKPTWHTTAGTLLPLIAIVLLGWQTFGAVIKAP